MKRPKTEIPTNAPDGTAWSGGPIEWFSITLTIRGDEVIPAEITARMGRDPDFAGQKGEPLYRSDGSLMRISQSGFWKIVLKPLDTDEWDCGEAIMQVLMRLPSDPVLWQSLSRQFDVRFFVGLRLPARNKGFDLSPEVLRYLGDRGIGAGFDIYYEEDAGRQEQDEIEG